MPPLILTLITVLSVILVLFVIYIFLIAPERRLEMQKYKGARFAHRGLHGDGAPENSISAFSRAIDRGYGIELDIRLSRDGTLVVFHDDTLDRVCGISGKVNEKSLDELKKYKLSDTEDTIPSLAEVLELVGGRVPLLVEIKEEKGSTAVTEAAIDLLSSYEGEFIVESFNPYSIALFKKRMPKVLRGILSDSFLKDKNFKNTLGFILQFMLTNVLARPNFVAFGKNGYKNPSLRICKTLGAVTLAWTTHSENEENEALSHGFDGLIFEKNNV